MINEQTAADSEDGNMDNMKLDVWILPSIQETTKCKV